MTRAELFFKKGFEVCLLNKVFAVIIRFHIKVQTHLMLEVTENCYHLMALWAELSQTTLHALKAQFLGIAPGDVGSGQHSHCRSSIEASWVLTLTVATPWPWSVGLIPAGFGLFAIFISLEFSHLTSSPPIYLWEQRSHGELCFLGAVLLTLTMENPSQSQVFCGERGRETG